VILTAVRVPVPKVPRFKDRAGTVRNPDPFCAFAAGVRAHNAKVQSNNANKLLRIFMIFLLVEVVYCLVNERALEMRPVSGEVAQKSSNSLTVPI